MRQLIRPTLFLLARLGLFLAVTTWAVSSDHRFILHAGHVGAALASEGWIFAAYEEEHYDFQVTPPEVDTYIAGYFDYPMPGLERAGGLSVGGFTVIAASGWLSLAFRHWLVVTVFIVLNLALHFIYRKRPKPQSCES